LGPSGILKERLSEFVNLVEISIVITLGSIENEWTFSNLIYIKNKLKNHLTMHLDMVIMMYAQKLYFLGTFSFYTTIQDWQTNKH
jgi:ABC-type arginine transport system ATPase subunit